MIHKIIELLHKDNYYGGGEIIELAKGKREYVTTFKDFKRKIKRVWLSKSK